MPDQAITCKCCHCQKDVTFHFERMSHLRHLGLTVATLGLWFPMWFLQIVASPKICDICGNPTIE